MTSNTGVPVRATHVSQPVRASRIVPQLALYVIGLLGSFAAGVLMTVCVSAGAEEGAASGEAARSSASKRSEEAFLPTWKLLKNEERKQFIAGYMFGWHDAAKVTDIVIECVKENPAQASDGLQRIRSLYDLQGLKPDTVVRELDAYFSRGENKDATLSQAVTAVRSNLGR